MNTPVRIRGMEFSVPKLTLTNDDMAKIVDTSDEWISSRSGIRRRHFSQGENTSDIAAKAAEMIIKKAGIDPLDIELLIVLLEKLFKFACLFSHCFLFRVQR